MEEKLEKLKDLWKNLKKSPGRTYTEATVRSKLEYIEKLRGEFQSIDTDQKDSEPLIALKLEFNSLYKIIGEYLSKSIRAPSDREFSMAAFNLDTASKALPLFSGNYEELESFLITAELIDKTLSETAKQDFLQYIYHAKLTSKVRAAIGNYVKPENFASLRKLLEQRYRCTKTIPELQSKLSAAYQGKLSVDQYREKITNIIDDLNKLGIEELGDEATEAERNIIIRLNNKLALESFKRGINENLKTALFAARPKSVQEAVELALEVENERKINDNNRVMHINGRQPHSGAGFNGNGSALYRRNYRNGGNRDNNNIYRNNSYNTNFYRNRNPFNQRNFGHNNYNSFRNNTRNWNSDGQRDNRLNNNNNSNRKPQNYRSRNTNRRFTIHTIQNEGNGTGSEYTSIPNSQN